MANPTLLNKSTPQAPLGSAVLPERVPQQAELQPIGGARPKLFYERHGILENPFGVTPNPHYLYQSRTHAEARSSLIIGIECGVGFQSLIAPPGMGKTTILFDLVERFNNVACTAFLFQPHGDSHSFLHYLLSELGDEAHDSDLVGMQDKINYLLIREHRAGRQTIVIVDEAQSLDTSVLETLRLLSNFETPTKKLLQIILAGQPQLAQRLANPELAQLCQRISIRTTLIPFDLEDTRKYIEHRLKIAGCQGPLLFTPEAVQLIWERSGGIPREINTLCFNALLLATALAQKQVDSDILHEVLADLDLNSIRSNTDTPRRSIQGVQTDDVLGFIHAARDPAATGTDKIHNGPRAKAEADNVYTRPAASEGVELVRLGTITAEILPASCRERSAQAAVQRPEAEAEDVAASAALPDRPALTNDRKTDAVTFADTRLVGVPSGETKATGNSREVPPFTPHGPDAHGANDSTTRTHQKRTLLTDTRWIGAIAALVIVSSFILGLIIRNLGKRNFELPSISRSEAPSDLKAARNTPSLEQQRTEGTREARSPFRTPQQDRRRVNRTHHTTTGSSARETVVGENPAPGTAVDKSSGQLPSTGKITNTEDDAPSLSETPMSKVRGIGVDDQAPNSTMGQTTTDTASNPGEAVVEEDSAPGMATDKSGQLPNVESGSAMSSARAAGANTRAGNSMPQTTPQSSETVVNENPAPGTADDKSSGKLSNVDMVPNTEDKADSVSEGVISSVPPAGTDSRAGSVANIAPARLIRKVNPTYPPAALEAQIQGSVVLQVIVDTNGAVHDVQFISGPPILGLAAIDAVEHWRYRPAHLNGQPLEWETLVTVKFSLR